MKRRAFMAMLGAAGLSPGLPGLPGGLGAPAGPGGGYTRYMYGLGVFHARTRGATSPAALMRLMRLDRGEAEAMLAEMTASGVLSPLGGVVQATRRTGPARPYLRRALRPEVQGPPPRAPLSCPATEGKQPPERGLETRSLSMNRFTTLTGIAAPMPLINIDTDMIIPKQFLKTIKRSGLGVNLFDEMRYDDDRREIPEFVLNKPQYREAQILVAGDNFGCGSSREHAPWAIADFGITCVIAPSFADIFYNNCFKNGILPIALPQEQIDVLMKDAEKGANARMTVDLEAQTVTTSDGEVFSFEVDPFKKHCLMNGLDDIGLTMEKAASIDSYESAARAERPWV